MIDRTMTIRSLCSALALMLAAVVAPDRAAADSSPYIGEIAATGSNFCPSGWEPAAGQLVLIEDNQALFALYGTTYGGDGRVTFALPDLRSRVPMGAGTGNGLTPRPLGAKGGSETVTLGMAQLAPHSHAVNVNNNDGDLADPTGNILAAAPPGGSGTETIYSDKPANRTMSSAMIGSSGLGAPFPTQDPALVIRYCVALTGIFPSRN